MDHTTIRVPGHEATPDPAISALTSVGVYICMLVLLLDIATSISSNSTNFFSLPPVKNTEGRKRMRDHGT